MLVSYTYRSDEEQPAEETELGATAPASASRAQGQGQAPSKQPEMKNFSFYTVVDLGVIVPRGERDVESPSLGAMETF